MTNDTEKNPWTQLVHYSPERLEAFVEKVYGEYGQAFKPVAVEKETDTVEVELKDGRRVKEKI